MAAASSEEIQELRMMMLRMMLEISDLKEALGKPKKINIVRDKSGKITGATSGNSSDRQELRS